MRASLFDRFTEKDIDTWYGSRELAKGRDYRRHVTQLRKTATEITALVQGTAARPYRVTLIAEAAAQQPFSRCTCPLGGACKHTVATLLVSLEHRNKDTSPPAPTVSAAPPAGDAFSWLQMLHEAISAPQKPSGRMHDNLFYVLHSSADPEQRWTALQIKKGRTEVPQVFPARATTWNGVERALRQTPSFVEDIDLPVLHCLQQLPRTPAQSAQDWNLNTLALHELLPRLLATDRLFLHSNRSRPLSQGPGLHGQIVWQALPNGQTRARCQIAELPHAAIIAGNPPWYIDPKGLHCGPISFDIQSKVATKLLAASALNGLEAELLSRELGETLPSAPSADNPHLQRLQVPPQAVLRVFSAPVALNHPWGEWPPYERMEMEFAEPFFNYGGLLIHARETREFFELEGQTVQLIRNPESERQALSALNNLGFRHVVPEQLYAWQTVGDFWLSLHDPELWADWSFSLAEEIEQSGWQIQIDPSFRFNFVEIDDIFAEINETQNGWFDLSLGFEIDGERYALAPLLANLLRSNSELFEGKTLGSLPPDYRLTTILPDGPRVSFSIERIRPILQLFIDLFDGSERLKVSKLDAPRLEELTRVTNTSGLSAVKAACERLRGAVGGVKAVAQPEGFGIQLRPYQIEGLGWLQHLREHLLGGILADDMGLGKTAQTLAHLLVEKQAGRLDLPSLIVLPTSLVFNWQREAERIAPNLTVLALHGPQRDFAAIPDYDLVLTTYPLIWRDAEPLKAQHFHYLILDEAQTVKNAASKAAGIIRNLNARHRLCLTGTPMENHLGELWSQFDFLLPGFLGDNKQFTRTWRTPIEKQNDSTRRELLAKRVKPFILRRRKEDVARELPPKTIVIRTVELTGSQRDLYEVVRSAMDQKVRDEIARRGFKRSQIVILDALLKLRQVCCDPRLVSLPSAARVKERAKLDLLMNMLPELIEEGRRILLFSQFTSMLALIQAELDKLNIAYVTLTGQTRNREAVIKEFQDGNVPLFLISLKAGGVGLNLTQADTVIHFDPWWNPAAEDQATDRAHRIGQTRAVFVYKLIAAGSIEERILALQEKKAALAAAVISGDSEGDMKFTETDLANLFAPLPR